MPPAKTKALPLTNETGADLHCPGLGPLAAGATVAVTESLAAYPPVAQLIEIGALSVGDELPKDFPADQVRTLPAELEPQPEPNDASDDDATQEAS